MKQPVFTGACSAIVTPFDKYGAIDYDVFGRLIEEQVAQGLDAICVCGTTGESATLSVQEHIAAVDFCVRRVNHRVRVIAGSGSNNTSTALYLTQQAQDSGADAALIVTPYYNKTSQAGLIRHYEHIADRSEIPIIMYNVPTRTGVTFTTDTYRVLSEHPRINGVKEASGDLSLLANARSVCGDALFFWSGNDNQVVPMMSLGAKGVISVAANLIPKVMVQITHHCLAGDFQSAADLQLEYMDLLEALFWDVNPIPIKTALNLTGRQVGGLRLPLCEMTAELQTQLRALLQAKGLLP